MGSMVTVLVTKLLARWVLVRSLCLVRLSSWMSVVIKVCLSVITLCTVTTSTSCSKSYRSVISTDQDRILL